MTSLVSQAVGAFVASLASGTPVATRIDRTRLRPWAQNVLLAVVVRPVESEVAETSLSPGYPVSWTTAVAVECYARTTAAAPADVAVDSLIEAVYARLMADPTLGGAVLAIGPRHLAFDFDTDAEQTVCATFTFLVRQRAGSSSFS